jgi:hypothetical protein
MLEGACACGRACVFLGVLLCGGGKEGPLARQTSLFFLQELRSSSAVISLPLAHGAKHAHKVTSATHHIQKDTVHVLALLLIPLPSQHALMQ